MKIKLLKKVLKNFEKKRKNQRNIFCLCAKSTPLGSIKLAKHQAVLQVNLPVVNWVSTQRKTFV